MAKKKLVNIVRPQRVRPGQFETFSREQSMMRELFGHGDHTILGEGDSLPVLHQTLTSGGGLIKNGDYEKTTASFFGFGR